MNFFSNKYLNITLLLIIISFIIGSLFVSINRGRCTKSRINFLHDSFEGIITEKMRGDHNKAFIRINSGIYKSIDPLDIIGAYDYIEVNDQIVKEKNTLECTILKEDGTMKKFKLNEPDCDKYKR